MTRRRSHPVDSKTLKKVGIVIKASADDIRRLFAAADEGTFDRIPIERADGTTTYVEVAQIDLMPLEPGQHGPNSWRRREDDKPAQGPDRKGDAKSR